MLEKILEKVSDVIRVLGFISLLVWVMAWWQGGITVTVNDRCRMGCDRVQTTDIPQDEQDTG